MNSTNIDYPNRSDAVKKIIEKAPSRILYIGFTSVAVILFSFIIVAWIVPYPETIEAIAVVSPSSPSGLVAPKVNSKISNFYVEEGDDVYPGDTVLSLKQPIDIENEVNEIMLYINESEQILDNVFNSDGLPEVNRELINHCKVEVEELMLKLDVYYRIWKSDELIEKTNAYEKLLLKSSPKSGINQSTLIKFKQTELEYLLSKQEWLNRKELDKSAVRLSIQKLKEKLKDIVASYFIVADKKGMIKFLIPTNIGQRTTMGIHLFAIIPQATDIECRLAVSPQKVADVKAGQNINIVLDQFSEHEYGRLNGKVYKVVPVPIDGINIVIVELIDGLVLSNGHEVNCTSKMSGKGEIIVRNQSLLTHLYLNLKVFKKD